MSYNKDVIIQSTYTNLDYFFRINKDCSCLALHKTANSPQSQKYTYECVITVADFFWPL